MSRQQLIPALLFALSLMGGAGSAAESCPADVLQRLAGAGYDPEGAARVCDLARAIGERGTLLQVRRPLVDEVADLLAHTAIADPQVNKRIPPVRQAVYCGSAGSHAGILLLVAGTAPLSLQPARCSDSLSALARDAARMATGNELAVAARVQLRWTPWRLVATIGEVAAASRAGNDLFASLALSIAASAFQHEIDLKDMLVPIALEESKLRMSAVVYFEPDSISLGFAQGEVPEVDLSQVPSLRGVTGSGFEAMPGNATIYVSHGAINDFAGDVFPRTPLGIGTTMILGNVELHELRVDGKPGRYTIQGRLTDLEGDVYDASIALTGDDLTLQDLRIRSEPDTCVDPMGKLCQDENIVRADIAAEATRSGAQILGARNGRAWSQYVDERRFPLPLGEDTHFLNGTVERTMADEMGLSLHLRFRIVVLE